MSRSLSQQAVRNTFTHFLLVAVNISTGFVVMPAIVHGIGITQFGIWAIANTVVGYASVLDLGLGQTLIKKTSEFLARGETDRLNETAGMVLTVYAILSGVALIVFVILAAFADAIFDVPPDLTPTLRAVLLIVGLVAALGFPMSILSGVMGGLHDFYVSNIVGCTLNVVKMFATFALLAAGRGLVALVILGAALSVAGWTCSFAWIRYRLPGFKVKPRALRGSPLRETARFSGSMFIWSMAGQAIQSLDRIIVALLLPVKFAGIYEIGARINTYSRYALNVVFVAMPAASALHAEGRHGELRGLYLQGTKLVFGVFGLIATGVFSLGGEFVRLWVGPGFDTSVIVAQVLVAASLFQSQNSLGHIVLVGAGSLRVFTVIMAAYPIVLVGCCTALGIAAGVVGVAFGILVTVVLLESVLLWQVLANVSVSLPDVLRSVHLRVVPSMLAAGGLTLLISRYREVWSWSDFVLRGALLVAAYSVSFAMLGMSRAERRDLFHRIGRAFANPK